MTIVKPKSGAVKIQKPFTFEYRKSSIRSRLCIILDSKFPRLVLESLQILLGVEKTTFRG